ncbi:hypothetical protein EDD85DRAFT_974529 [Armillaria nabsnona]|nr:hypothetical protein EDD85DRAFT_974529 [Armillaria nabsnona]
MVYSEKTGSVRLNGGFLALGREGNQNVDMLAIPHILTTRRSGTSSRQRARSPHESPTVAMRFATLVQANDKHGRQYLLDKPVTITLLDPRRNGWEAAEADGEVRELSCSLEDSGILSTRPGATFRCLYRETSRPPKAEALKVWTIVRGSQRGQFHGNRILGGMPIAAVRLQQIFAYPSSMCSRAYRDYTGTPPIEVSNLRLCRSQYRGVSRSLVGRNVLSLAFTAKMRREDDAVAPRYS